MTLHYNNSYWATDPNFKMLANFLRLLRFYARDSGCKGTVPISLRMGAAVANRPLVLLRADLEEVPGFFNSTLSLYS